MSRIVCPCSRTVEILNDGKNWDILAECEQCSSNHGDYTKSSAWVESDRDVSQLDKLGKHKPAEHEEPDHRPLKKRKK